MEFTTLAPAMPNVSRIGLGTWAFGGDMWGRTDEKEAIRTVRTALENNINLIDTAPVYGYGRSEEIVGKAIAESGTRDKIYIATKFGLSWADGKVHRDGSRENIVREIEASLSRLRTDYIDLYQMHWQDPSMPVEETAETLYRLFEEGKIRAIGVSNFSVEELKTFRKVAPVHVVQIPYNLFEREVEHELLPYCKENEFSVLVYSPLCRGLLTGKITEDYQFQAGDFRQKDDPKFQLPRLNQYLNAVNKLDQLAQEHYDKRIIHLAIRWLLDQSVDVALWGARHPEQLHPLEAVFDWSLTPEDLEVIDEILEETISNPVGPEFMAPPIRTN